MSEIWKKIEQLRDARIGFVPNGTLPDSLREEVEYNIIAKYANQNSLSEIDLPEEFANVADKIILLAWSYTTIREFKKAYSELSSIDLRTKNLTDDQFIAIIELLAMLNNTFADWEQTTTLLDVFIERFPAQIPRRALRFHNSVGVAHLWIGDLSTALEQFQLVSATSLFFGNLNAHSEALTNIGIVYKNMGNLDLASHYVRRSLEIARKYDHELCATLNTWSNICFWRGEFKTALRSQQEALPKSNKSSVPRVRVAARIAIGRSLLLLRSFDEARTQLETALDMAISENLPREISLAYEFLGDLESTIENSPKAGELYRKAMEVALRVAPRTDLVTEIGRRLAEWHIERGEFTHARLELERALDLAIEINDKREEAILYRVKAQLLVATGGRRQSAETLLRKSIDIMGGMGARYEEALSRAELGRIRIDAPRRTRNDRLKGIDDLCSAAAVFGDLDLPEHQGELLIETVKRGEGLLDPNDSLGMLREAELSLRPFRENGGIKCISELRHGLESEIARRAIDDEKHLLSVREAPDAPLDRSLHLLATRLSAKKAFLYLRDAPEGPRTLGGDSADALPILDRLSFPGDQVLVVSAGDLTGEGSECHGPYIAYRNVELDSLIYIERALGSNPFTELEAGEFVSFSTRLLKRIPARAGLTADRHFPRVVTSSPNMRELIDRIAFLRNSMASVLIRGETGTGKGILARLLHDLGDRAHTGRFVQVHCAEFPETLIESELFGHVRGAFTGAFTSKQGLIEHAEGGTLFLDEIGDLSPSVQLRLLRVIEEKRLKRVGDNRDREVNIRVVAATHRNLEAEIERENFREDLYYRLNVITLVVPPLRDRRDDVPLLADHFLSSFSTQEGKERPAIDEETMRRLKLYTWPGNVRELQNEMRRLIALLPSGVSIRMSDLSERILHNGKASRFLRRPGQLSFQKQESNLQDALDSLEQEWIREALVEGKGKAKATAEILGISPQLLRYKMKKYGFTLPGRG